MYVFFSKTKMSDRYIKKIETIFYFYFTVCNYALESMCMPTTSMHPANTIGATIIFSYTDEKTIQISKSSMNERFISQKLFSAKDE